MVAVPMVREVFSKYLLSLTPELAILEAIDLLVAKRVPGAPVVEGGALVGVLTEKDCLRVLSSSAWGEMAGGTVRDYMSKVRATLSVDMDLFAAALVFLDCNFPILPVLDGDRLVGRLTRQELLRRVEALNRSLQRAREKQEKRLGRAQRTEELAQLSGSIKLSELASLLRDRR